MQNRPDVRAARFTFESAQASVKLAKANRIPDPTIGLTVYETERITNQIDPAPSYNSLNLSLSIPLPVFNSYRGEYQAAVATLYRLKRSCGQLSLRLRSTFERALIAIG